MSNESKILRDDWKARKAAKKADKQHADAHNTIARMLNNLSIIEGGHSEVSAQFIRLFCLGGSFSGVYWFKGKRYALDMRSAKAYWYHNEATSSGDWSDGPLPEPMPDMMYWRTTSECGPVEYIMC